MAAGESRSAQDRRSVVIGLVAMATVGLIVLHLAGVTDVDGLKNTPDAAGPLGVYWVADQVLGHPWVAAILGAVLIVVLSLTQPLDRAEG